MARSKNTSEAVEKNLEVQENTVEKQEVKPEKRKLQREDLIPVMNYTSGLLVYESRNGRGWRFENYGDTDEIELAELISIKNSQSRILNEPWMLILDDDAVEYLGLKKLYENVIKPDDMENLFTLPDDRLEEVLRKAPASVKQLVADKAKQMIDNKKLNSLSTIQLVERVLNVELIEK